MEGGKVVMFSPTGENPVMFQSSKSPEAKSVSLDQKSVFSKVLKK